MRQPSIISVHALLASALFLLAACAQPAPTGLPTTPPGARPTPTVASPPGLNPVALGGLGAATRIDILEFSAPPGAGAQPGYVQRLAVADPKTVSEIVSTLNVDLKPLPKARCIPEFELHFRLSGGGVQKLGYSCQGASFLRGDQPAWRDQDGQPPAAFDALMRDLLAAPTPKP